MTDYCEAPECDRPTRGGRTYCETHQKRLQRGGSLWAPVVEQRTPWERFEDAVLRYADLAAEADEAEFRRARDNLRDAAKQWARREGVGRPPKVDAAEAARLWRTLKSVRGVARALGATKQSVRRALERAGVRKFRTQGRTQDFRPKSASKSPVDQ